MVGNKREWFRFEVSNGKAEQSRTYMEREHGPEAYTRADDTPSPQSPYGPNPNQVPLAKEGFV